jgi:hypothetical protein
VQAAPALRNARLAEELKGRVDELDRQSEQLARSRGRLLAARDAERARIARTVQRQVMPHLEAVAHELEEPRADTDERLHVIERLIENVNTALDELRTITHGIFPAELSRFGLFAALRAHLFGVELVVPDDRRFAEGVELAAYFCCVEAVQLMSGPVRVTVSAASEELRIEVSGQVNRSADISLLTDRLAPLDGSVRLGTDALTIGIPCPQVSPAPPAMTPAGVSG